MLVGGGGGGYGDGQGAGGGSSGSSPEEAGGAGEAGTSSPIGWTGASGIPVSVFSFEGGVLDMAGGMGEPGYVAGAGNAGMDGLVLVNDGTGPITFDNPRVSASHYHTTAMGLYSFVTKEQFLACMKRFGTGEYNGIRYLTPHVMMQLDNGFVMPNGVLHSPTNLCTHELHVTMDEHFLAEDLTLDGRIGAANAFYACREEDYPKDRHEDWDYLVEKFDFAANQDPDFVQKHSRPAIPAEEFEGDGVTAKWIVYGDFLGEQRCSILRLTVQPGGKTNFCPESPTLFHTNGGSGRVGKLEIRYHQDMTLGEIYPEIGFVTQAALSGGGVEIENTGTEPLVLTFDFPLHAHSQTPGGSVTH